MNIFFIGSIRGGRAQQPMYALIVRELQKYGAVSSQHVSDDTLSQYGETDIENKDILKREGDALALCDAVVAEVTVPSLGVGYLLAHATSEHKKVIALYQGENTLELSSIIKGDPGISVQTYKTELDIQKILKETLETNQVTDV